MTTPEGDTRWTAILSTDMVGFTEMSHEIGQEQIYGLLSYALGVATEIVEAHGGHVIDTAGDGLLAAFGAPRALENACLQCCRAAEAFRQRMMSEVDDLQVQFGVRPAFRTGLGGGNTMIAHLDNGGIKVVGLPVNKAARLQALAGPNEIILSETIRREAEALLRTTDRGEVEIKGFAEPVHIHALDGLVETATRFDEPRQRGLVGLVSREAELAALLATFAPGAPGRVTLISGVAGIGKSRLVHEFQQQVPDNRPVYVGQCAPDQLSRAYGPVFDVLRQASGSPDDADTGAVLARLINRHPGLCDPDDMERFLAPTDGELPQNDRALRDRAFLLQVLAELNKAEACIFVVEDAHWIDSATAGLIATLPAIGTPLILTSRPEFDASWMTPNESLRIDLTPLPEGDIRRIAEDALGGDLSQSLADLIAEKSEGVPLVAEELVRALRYDDRLVESADGLDYRGDGTLLTGNLEQLVLSRIDRLSDQQRATLQTASAIGRDFSEDVLSAALGRDSAIATIAAEPGLVEQSATGQWRFAHALIRDAVYGSLLGSHRKAAHARIAGAIEGQGGAASRDWALLAEHFMKADNPEKAVPAMIRAAAGDLNVYALGQVDRTLEQAMQYVEIDPDIVDQDQFRDLAVTWLRAIDQMGDFGRLTAVSDRVLPRLERAGYSPALSIARTLTAISLTHTRDYEGAEALALATLRDAEDQSDPWGAAWAKVALMRTYEETGWQPCAVVERLAAEIQPVAEATDDRHLAMASLYLLSAIYRSTGYRLKALDVADQIVTFAETHEDRRATAYAAWARALVHSTDGNPELSLSTVQPARREALPHTADETVSRGIKLFAQTFLLPPDEVRPKLLDLIAETRRLRDYNLVHSMEWTRSVLELKAGHLALGWKLVTQLIPKAEVAGHAGMTRQCLMMRGELLLTIAGLIDPESEAPPDRPRFARGKPGLADIATFLKLKLIAKRQAARDLNRCLELTLTKDGIHYARARIGLGLIARARGQTSEAIDHLTTGLDIARAEGMELLSQRAARALTGLTEASDQPSARSSSRS